MKNENYKYFFTKSIRLRDGRIIYASDYGKNAFKIKVRSA